MKQTLRFFPQFVHVALLLFFAISLSAADKPNVLLIMTDDQGWGDIRSHGNPKIDTPNMDAIAAQGARFERFYVSPVCAPTRASLLSGRYHLRTGVSGVTRGFETMRSSEITIAEALKSGGYATGCFGKWHSGRHYPVHPNGQGFDEFFGFCGGHWQNYFSTHLERNGERVETKGYITDVLTDAAMKFIEQKRDEPWFCYIPYNAPHSPWEVPDKYWEKYADRDLDAKARCAYAMIDCVDVNIGRILRQLDQLKLADNTIVIFLTDNGPNSARYNGVMRGRKGSVHEGGVRVPLFIRWPGKINSGIKIKPLAAHIDLLPTILEMCGVEKTAGPTLDGKSLWPLLAQRNSNWPDRMIFTDTVRGDKPGAHKGAVRTDRWRATYEKNRWSLFDMQTDPSQKKDVAREHIQVTKRLAGSFEDWLRGATNAGLDYIPIPLGHPQRSHSELPAHEAFLTPEAEKGINYISRPGFANAWVTEWTDTSAFLHWEVDVQQAGNYEMTLLYNCRPEDVGSRIIVEIGGKSMPVKIAEAFYPPYHPSPDRVPKTDDHYEEKDWKPLRVGTVKLATGTNRLQIKALKKPGTQVVEIKAIRVKLLP